ncbi:MAG: polyhydroxyalkanoic acid system family protein [Pirellulaceae bacterium]
MSSFRTEVQHQLGKEKATERLKTFLEQVAERYKDQVSHLDGTWADNILKFALTTYGFNISGTLTVEDNLARLEGKLPLAALAFRGKIEQSIAAELARELSA